jgi:hypothetical protein
MKKLFVYLSIGLLVMLLGAGTALAQKGGGSPEPTGGNCPTENWPLPNSGPYLMGAFTSSYVRATVGPPMVVTHFTLTYGLKTYVFEHWKELPSLSEKQVCDQFDPTYCWTEYTYLDADQFCTVASDNAFLLDFFKKMGCSWGVQGVNGAFGLNGIAVLKSVKVLKKDFCAQAGTPYSGLESVVSGIVTFRVVPY